MWCGGLMMSPTSETQVRLVRMRTTIEDCDWRGHDRLKTSREEATRIISPTLTVALSDPWGDGAGCKKMRLHRHAGGEQPHPIQFGKASGLPEGCASLHAQ